MMEPWMIGVAVVAAIVIVCIPKILKNWYQKSPKMAEIREGVKAIEDFQNNYPTVESYEETIIRELRGQEADIDFIRNLLGDAYKPTLTQAYKKRENPIHFTDRWLFSALAPKRWDYIAGILHYYMYIMQALLSKQCRPTQLVHKMGGKEEFLKKIESAYAKELDPDILIEKELLAEKEE